MKEIAPSTELRKWFGHDPARWDEFQRRYRAELTAHPAELDRLRALAGKQVVTRSEEHTSELQSLMRISYAVFCLKKNTKHYHNTIQFHNHYFTQYTA